MAIKPKEERVKQKPVIDLLSPQGNVHYLLGLAQSYSRQLGYSEYEQTQLLEDMKESDYEHLIEVFDEHFGTLIDLQR